MPANPIEGGGGGLGWFVRAWRYIFGPQPKRYASLDNLTVAEWNAAHPDNMVGVGAHGSDGSLIMQVPTKGEDDGA